MAEDSNSESASMLDNGEDRVDAGYPGSGFIPDGDERSSVEGVMKTATGHEYALTLKTFNECIGTFMWIFLGTLATVQVLAVHTTVRNTGVAAIGAYSVDNSTGTILNMTEYSAVHGSYAFLNQANGLRIAMGDQTVMDNPVATPLVAFIWAALFFLIVSFLPGTALNPWVSLNHWWFAWKAKGKVSFTHFKHLTMETFLAIGAQFAGGILAIICVYFIFERDTGLLGETLPGPTLNSEAKVILYEAIGSFLFMTLINIYSRPRRNVSATQQVGLIATALFFVIMCFNGFTGASLNFVRTFSPALVRTVFSGVPMRLSVLYYLIGQAAGYGAAGLLAWFFNNAAHARLFRAVTSSSKYD